MAEHNLTIPNPRIDEDIFYQVWELADKYAHTQSSRIFLRTSDNRMLDNIHKVSMFKIIKDMKEEVKTLRNIFGKKRAGRF